MEYLYQTKSGWLESATIARPEDYVIAARLYALGERLQAKDFQRIALQKFMEAFNDNLNLGDQAICDLLEIACTELPERVQEDQLKAQIYWYATRMLSSLKEYNYFVKLLDTHKGLGKEICLRASPGIDCQPSFDSQPLSSKFTPASIY